MLHIFHFKNANIKEYVGKRLLPQKKAEISAFDSPILGGKAIWRELQISQRGVLYGYPYRKNSNQPVYLFSFTRILLHKIKRIFTDPSNTAPVGTIITYGMDARMNTPSSCLFTPAAKKPFDYSIASYVTQKKSSPLKKKNSRFLDSISYPDKLRGYLLWKTQACIAAALLSGIASYTSLLGRRKDISLMKTKINSRKIITDLAIRCSLNSRNTFIAS